MAIAAGTLAAAAGKGAADVAVGAGALEAGAGLGAAEAGAGALTAGEMGGGFLTGAEGAVGPLADIGVPMAAEFGGPATSSAFTPTMASSLDSMGGFAGNTTPSWLDKIISGVKNALPTSYKDLAGLSLATNAGTGLMKALKPSPLPSAPGALPNAPGFKFPVSNFEQLSQLVLPASSRRSGGGDQLAQMLALISARR